jgi:glucuronokinase
MDFYQVGIDRRVQPSLALSVEKEELGIGAGLQDRVIQVYEGLVAMDFSRDRQQLIEGYECGIYESLDPAVLPPVYIAFRADVSEPTEVFHNNLRARYDSGEPEVRQAMDEFAALTDQARAALDQRDAAGLAAAVNANFAVRRRICQLHPGHLEMVDTARRAGASAKFAGSGGAIVGTYEDPDMLARLTDQLGRLGCRVFCPKVTNQQNYPEWLEE